MTAYTQEEEIRKCMRAGCSHVLPKPLSHQKLWKLLNQIRSEPVELVLLKKNLQDLIPGYIHNRYRDLHEIARYLEDGDYNGIGFIGHRMKGSGSGYGLDSVSRLGKAIETAALMKQSSAVVEAAAELADYLAKIKVIYMGHED